MFTIGADPEVFLADNGLVRSVVGKVGGSKHRPLPLPLGEGYAVQEDNVALEFCIPACSTKSQFVRAIRDTSQFLETAMKDQYGWGFDRRSAVSFPASELTTPQSHEFGCEPDYNVWTKKKNPRPHAEDSNLRSAGGHVHIGFTGLNPDDVVKGCDLFLGVPSVLMDEGDLRKRLYGKAGAFRTKPYGIEYRTLSNFWIFEESTVEWVYTAVERLLKACSEGMNFDKYKDSILKAIDENDTDTAVALVHELRL